MRKVKTAVIGAGYWGPNLIRVANALSDSQLVAICDANPKRLEAMGRNYPGARLLDNLDALCADAEIEAVIVALPASQHFSAAQKLLAAGKHCMVEKPLATTSWECRELIRLAEDKGLTLMVGHTFEYNDAVRRIKSDIDAGELGEVFHIFSQRLNLGQVRQDVDVLWNLTPHDISIIFYWLDGVEPVAVAAQGLCHLQDGIADMGYITLEFPNGRAAHIMASWLSPEKIRKMMVVGSKKMVVYDDVSLDNKVQIFDKGFDRQDPESGWGSPNSFGEFQLQVRTGDLVIPNIKFTEPLQREVKHFIECVHSGERPISDGYSGLRVTKVLEAATLSMKQGGRRVLWDEIESQAKDAGLVD